MKQANINKYIIAVIAIYVASFILGFIVPPKKSERLVGSYKTSLSPIATKQGLSRLIYITYRNSLTSLLIIATGVAFGVIPAVLTSMNGYLDGATFSLISSKIGYTRAAIVIFPHGTIEIIALVISATYGLWLGSSMINKLKHDASINMVSNVIHAAMVGLTIVLPLLALAALIEVYITPLLIKSSSQSNVLEEPGQPQPPSDQDIYYIVPSTYLDKKPQRFLNTRQQ